MEEDIALSNIALDLIGQARALFGRACVVAGDGRGEDDLACLRDAHEFLNVQLVERPNGDFAHTIVRQFFYSAFALPHWAALTASTDPTLAAIAAKSEKEARYHVRHSGDWMLRLGDGTEESHRRTQEAVTALWPYTGELFAADALDEAAAADGFGVPGGSLQGPWEDTVRPVLEEATLRIPEPTPFCSRGKGGMHSEHMGHLLAEMQYMQRTYPGLQW